MSNKLRSLKRKTYTQATDFSLATVKNWLKMDELTADDAIITSLIESGVSCAEDYTGQVFGTATYTATYDYIYERDIRLLYSPVVSVEELRGIDEDGTVSVMDSDDYYVIVGDNGSVNVKLGSRLPDSDRCSARHQIDYTVGMGNGAVPQSIIDGVNIYVQDLYENRKSMTEKSLNEAPFDSKALWAKHRVNLI